MPDGVVFNLGDVFHLVGKTVRSHPYVIISDPFINHDEVVTVNMTDASVRIDRSCVLNIGDHVCITKETVINYGDAKTPSTQDLADLYSRRQLTFDKQKCSSEILKRIQIGLIVSQFAKPRHKEIVLSQGHVKDSDIPKRDQF